MTDDQIIDKAINIIVQNRAIKAAEETERERRRRLANRLMEMDNSLTYSEAYEMIDFVLKPKPSCGEH